jgi:cytochrome c oxidase assembly protein subunit 15
VIEFSNRMLTFALTVVVVATVVAVFRSPRRDLRGLAVLSFLGIPAQALLGGMTVLTGLNPWLVAAHFLLSMVLVAVATILWLRSREPGVGQPLVSAPFLLLTRLVATVTAAGRTAVIRRPAAPGWTPRRSARRTPTSCSCSSG